VGIILTFTKHPVAREGMGDRVGPRLLLLSNSTNFAKRYLEHAVTEILDFLGPVRRIAFVPFALHDQAGYWKSVRDRFRDMEIEVDRMPADRSAGETVLWTEAVFVGGGNTFRLIDGVRRTGLIEPLRRRVTEGMPYIGSSAGTVIAGPTMMTTNDMPIVQPESFEGLGLVPFQINCHYLDAEPTSNHMGETREERLREFHEENDTPVVGLREGAWLRVEGEGVTLGGTAGARIFFRGRPPEERQPGEDLFPRKA
jgi:dipeptidase E